LVHAAAGEEGLSMLAAIFQIRGVVIKCGESAILLDVRIASGFLVETIAEAAP
jgi:hypothetical protein